MNRLIPSPGFHVVSKSGATVAIFDTADGALTYQELHAALVPGLRVDQVVVTVLRHPVMRILQDYGVPA